MLRTLKNDERGWTLIELLVVILIIGILTAIALPSFLGQEKKSQDASAKSDARNAVSHVESCYTGEQDYSKCTKSATSPAAAMVDAGLPATVTIAAPDGTNKYTVTATSKSGTSFTVVKDASGAFSRDCTEHGTGACKSSADAAGNYW